jgi:hypothetical protein
VVERSLATSRSIRGMPVSPLLIEFAAGSSIHREPDFVPRLPILQNGPPGTSVVFADGSKVPLPTDQIVLGEDHGGAARVGFGGMSCPRTAAAG